MNQSGPLPVWKKQEEMIKKNQTTHALNDFIAQLKKTLEQLKTDQKIKKYTEQNKDQQRQLIVSFPDEPGNGKENNTNKDAVWCIEVDPDGTHMKLSFRHDLDFNSSTNHEKNKQLAWELVAKSVIFSYDHNHSKEKTIHIGFIEPITGRDTFLKKLCEIATDFKIIYFGQEYKLDSKKNLVCTNVLDATQSDPEPQIKLNL